MTPGWVRVRSAQREEGKRTAELLHEHDDFGRDHGVAVAAHGEDLHDAAALADGHGLLLGLKQGVCVEEIACGLDLFEAQPADRVEGVLVAVLGEVPSGRLWADEDETACDDGWDHGGSHHQTPVQAQLDAVIGHKIEAEVGNISYHDAEGCPHLPLLMEC